MVQDVTRGGETSPGTRPGHCAGRCDWQDTSVTSACVSWMALSPIADIPGGWRAAGMTSQETQDLFGGGGGVYKKTQTPQPAGFWLSLVFVHPNPQVRHQAGTPPSAASQGSAGVAACAPQRGKLRLGRWQHIPAWPQQGATSIPLDLGIPALTGGCPSLQHASVEVGCNGPLHTNNPSRVSSMHWGTAPSLSSELDLASAAAETSPAPPSLSSSILQTPRVSQCPQPPPCTESHLFN